MNTGGLSDICVFILGIHVCAGCLRAVWSSAHQQSGELSLCPAVPGQWADSEQCDASFSNTEYMIHHNPFVSLSLSVGDITQKGYEKKRGKLLAPYIPQIQGKQLTLINCTVQPLFNEVYFRSQCMSRLIVTSSTFVRALNLTVVWNDLKDMDGFGTVKDTLS